MRKSRGQAHENSSSKICDRGKKRGVVLGGQGHGKLTGTTIKTLANYYDNAIRSNRGNLEDMREAVFVSFFHVISTDEDPPPHPLPRGGHQLVLLPEGTGQRRGTIMRMFTQPCHAWEVAGHVKDVYLRLGHSDLLNRCLRMETQNKNECIHSKIWMKCPKMGLLG